MDSMSPSATELGGTVERHVADGALGLAAFRGESSVPIEDALHVTAADGGS